MALRVEFHRDVEKDLRRLGLPAARRIKRFLDEDLPRYPDPRDKAKALTGELSGLWRYRIGDYRLVCEITQDQDGHLVFCILAAHRSQAYKSRQTKAVQKRQPD